MDSFRIFAGIVFAVSVFLLIQAWIKEHQPPSSTSPTTSAPKSTTPEVPSSPPAVAQQPVPTERMRGQRVTVETDTLRAEIDTAGADLRRVELLKYRDTLDPKKNF